VNLFQDGFAKSCHAYNRTADIAKPARSAALPIARRYASSTCSTSSSPGESQAAAKANPSRYKTELCRPYQESIL
jgi:hypothetical protein